MHKLMWEILVPAYGKQESFSYEYHNRWNSFVREIAGGLSVLSGIKGEWIAPDGTLFRDRMIPVRIVCSEEEIEQIIQFTIKHYNQKAVLAYQVSNYVIIRHRKD